MLYKNQMESPGRILQRNRGFPFGALRAKRKELLHTGNSSLRAHLPTRYALRSTNRLPPHHYLSLTLSPHLYTSGSGCPTVAKRRPKRLAADFWIRLPRSGYTPP